MPRNLLQKDLHMYELMHWHPVLKSDDLHSAPVKIRILNHDIVMFRDELGKIGALNDICPHRKMKLSEGSVQNGRLVCPYHGWNLGTDGDCISPSSGKIEIAQMQFEAAEKYGAVWIRIKGSSTEFPKFSTEGYEMVSIHTDAIAAPLEVVLDNFTETEHTSSVHAFLGYDEQTLDKVEIRLESTENSVRLYNKGQQKPLPFLLRAALSLGSSDDFVDDWTTYFSPVYTVYDQYWINPEDGKERKNRLKIYVFLIPESENVTRLFIFSYMIFSLFMIPGTAFVFSPILHQLLKMEVDLDKKMIEKLADKSPSLKGTKLTKFDKALGPNRSRIGKIYRGGSES